MKKTLLIIALFFLQLQSVFAGTITHMSVTQLEESLHVNKFEKILFFFTAWCKHCHEITMTQDFPKNKIIFIAIDPNKAAIEKMAQDMKYDIINIMPDENSENLVELSKNLKIKFAFRNEDNVLNIHFPYIVALDKNNKVIADDIKQEDIHQYIQ